MRSRFSLVGSAGSLLLGGLFLAPLAHAVVWPGPAPCNGTLQTCIDAQPSGARVEIASNGPITSTVELARSVTLRGAEGFQPVLSAQPAIRSFFSLPDPVVATVENLRVESGSIELRHLGSGTADIRVRRISMLNTTPGASFGVYVESGTESGSMTFDVREVEFERRGAAAGPITVFCQGAPCTGNIAFNRIRVPDNSSSGWGIVLGRDADSTIEANIYGNEIRGDFSLGQIGVIGTSFAGATTGSTRAVVASNVLIGRTYSGTGIAVRGDNSAVDARIYNNTIVKRSTGIAFAPWETATTPNLGGSIANNLVAFNRFSGINLHDAASSVSNRHNLIHASGTNPGFVAGPGTLTADPLLYSQNHPRLLPGSPAIGAGDAAVGVLGTALAGIPQLDADGLRRFSGGDIEIGAYEYGDLSVMHRATVANTQDHVTDLDDVALGTSNSSRLLITPNYNAGGAFTGPSVGDPLGIYNNATGSWAVFNQNFQDMPVGAKFNVFHPVAGPGVITHVSTAANIGGPFTTIDDVALNDQPDKFVLLTQNWTLGGSAVYNPRPVGVFFFSSLGGGGGSWLVAETDSAVAMPENLGFNLYVQDPSPNAFLATATSATRVGQVLKLDHPLLNDNPCALVHATRVYTGVEIPQHFDVRFSTSDRRWGILQHDVPSMALGTRFHVLVHPRQAHECGASLFADGFDFSID